MSYTAQPYFNDMPNRIRVPSHISTFQALILFVCTLAAFTAHVDARRIPDDSKLIDRALHRDECGFGGNPDLYGLGIRVGYYSQLVATCLSNIFTPADTRGVRTVNLWFELSLFAGLIFQATQEDFYAVESCVVVVLLLGFSYTNVWTPSIYLTKDGTWRKTRPRPNTCARLTIVMSSLMHLTVPIYSVWFWWRGMDNMLSNPCATYSFFFSRVNIFQWYRMLNKALSLYLLVSILIFVIRSIRSVMKQLRPPENRNRYTLLYYFDGLMVPEEEDEEIGIQREPSAGNRLSLNPRQITQADPNDSQIRWYYFVATILPPSLIVFTVLSVEFTLQWNKVSGVNDLHSVGQLIPFVLGVGNMMQVCKNIYLKARKRWTRKIRAETFQCTSNSPDIAEIGRAITTLQESPTRHNTDSTLVPPTEPKKALR